MRRWRSGRPIGPLGLLARRRSLVPVPEGRRRKLAGGKSALSGRCPRSGDEIGACPGGASEKRVFHRAEFPPVPLRGRDLHAAANRGRRRSPCPRLMSCGAPLAQGHFRTAAFLRYRRRPRLRVRAATRCPALTFFSSGAGGLGPSGWDRVRWWGGLGRAQRVPTRILQGGGRRFLFGGKPGRVRGVLWDRLPVFIL